MLDVTTRIVLPNEPYLHNRNPFPLENKLRSLKVIEHTYVVGVLDCCRQVFNKKEEIYKGIPKSDIIEEEEHNVNLILVFGCEPRLLVKAQSGISRSLVAHLAKEEKDGVVVLPEAIMFYNYESKIEKTIIVT